VLSPVLRLQTTDWATWPLGDMAPLLLSPQAGIRRPIAPIGNVLAPPYPAWPVLFGYARKHHVPSRELLKLASLKCDQNAEALCKYLRGVHKCSASFLQLFAGEVR